MQQLHSEQEPCTCRQLHGAEDLFHLRSTGSMQQVSGVFLFKELMRKVYDLQRDQGKYTEITC